MDIFEFLSLTLPLANSVVKGYQLNLISNGGSGTLVVRQGSNTIVVPGATTTVYGLTYFASYVSDGNSSWYVINDH